MCRTHADVAQKLLENFVVNFGKIYGYQHLVLNVHSLMHIVDDVKNYGNLDDYSAFVFESFMYVIKRCLYKHNDSLAELSNRIEESYILNKLIEYPDDKIQIKKKKK